MHRASSVLCAILLTLLWTPFLDAAAPQIATFQVDVTPPIGSPLCDGLVEPAKEIVDRLSARGIILWAGQSPMVLCAVDWVGIGNSGHEAWCNALAKAAGTTPDRVAVHCLHQHDAPGCDFDAEMLLAQHGLAGRLFDVAFARQAIASVADAVQRAATNRQPLTHVGMGSGRVDQVASNRRILGDDGKVKFVRYSSCKDEIIRAEPEGTIDPMARAIGFWNDNKPIAVLTYYATHPQSYYGKGGVSSDFVGMARSQREADTAGLFHVHFNGAGGNVAAGKYNDGSPPYRKILADRLAAGMKLAWDSAVANRTPITTEDINWQSVAVALPARDTLDEQQLLALIENAERPIMERCQAGRDLTWLRRCRAGHQIRVAALRLGTNFVIHMPGELFVEYQLAAQSMNPDRQVAMAAYGDYGPGYIGTKIAYSQGGYETTRVSRTAPEVEEVLLAAMRKLLQARP